ncbi:MAG TPA: tail fiber domain-containing protein [Chthoniobacterales bacterium]|jgi:hypothetical protein
MINPMLRDIFTQLIKSTGHAAGLRRSVLLGALIVFVLSPCTWAVNPPPDGGYDSFNTAEGLDALFSLLPGPANTALGNAALYHTTTGSVNTGVGAVSLYYNTTGGKNTAIGDGALYQNMATSNNTAVGATTLNLNSTGSNNTAIGQAALIFTMIASNNTATGSFALRGSTSGTNNTADGANALYEDSIMNDHTGSRNVAIGSAALYSNSSGGDNTAVGVNALYFNKSNYNTATGYQALESNTTGANNTADGIDSLNANTTGSNNTTNGAYALFNNLGGSGNTAEGDLALHENTSGLNNTALGTYVLYGNTTGGSNIAVGFSAGFGLTTGSNNIDLGNIGMAGETGIIRIGTAGTQMATFVAGIKGVPVTGSPVTVSSTGQLGIKTSSARFKEKIKPMEKASEPLLSLKPVTFRYKHEVDAEGLPQFGLVAEEVAKVNPDLVTRDEQGKPDTVRYDAVNAMLLNEFLKKHHQGEEQASKIQKLEATVKQLESLLSQRAAEIQRVTDQLARSEDKTSPEITNRDL